MNHDIQNSLNSARQYIELHDNNDAQILLLDILTKEPNNMAALLMLGGSYFSSEKYSEAEMVFARLILLESANGQFSIALFNVLMKLDRHEEALEEIKRFLQNADKNLQKDTILQYQEILQTLFNN